MQTKRIAVLLIAVVLTGTLLGCTLSGILVTPTPTPTPTALPLPTVAQPQVTAVPAAPANELEAQVAAVYDLARPAVVNITSRIYAYDFFFNPVPQEGTGSGFIYDSNGHIVTNYHVIENAQEVSVTLADGRTLPATIVGTDPSNDLAVIRIEAEELPAPLALGDSDSLRVGQFVVAIGNPFGQVGTLTVGVISALGRIIESPDGRFIGEAIQTDAAINPGNSGGPLLDLQGRVIGVNSQIISPAGANVGIGFAVPVNTVRRVVPQLIAKGRYSHPWLGVSILSLTPRWAQALGEAGVEVPDHGLLVLKAVSGGPAAQAGIRGGNRILIVGNRRIPVGGDVIVALNGQPVSTYQELNVYLETQTQVGDTITVTIIREGVEQNVSVTLTERPAQ